MRNFTPTGPAWLSESLWQRFAQEGTTAHRLCTTPEGWVERLGDDVLISYTSDSARDALRASFEAWTPTVGFAPLRVWGKFLPKQNADRIAPLLLAGDAALPPTGVVLENGVRYGVDFEAGYSAGLFIDQRQNRVFLRSRKPKRVLNTFAYTCAFSVVSALEGAQTVSIDLSKKSLQRGQENFGLNGLSLEGHRFLADDVQEVLPRLARRGEQFDAIILDPPTFSRGAKGRKWQVEQGFESLLKGALEVAAPKAAILLSHNCTRLERATVEGIARYALKLTRRQGTFHREPDLPDVPPGSGARTTWLLLS